MNETDPFDYGEGKRPWEESADSTVMLGLLVAGVILVLVVAIVLEVLGV